MLSEIYGFKKYSMRKLSTVSRMSMRESGRGTQRLWSHSAGPLEAHQTVCVNSTNGLGSPTCIYLFRRWVGVSIAVLVHHATPGHWAQPVNGVMTYHYGARMTLLPCEHHRAGVISSGPWELSHNDNIRLVCLSLGSECLATHFMEKGHDSILYTLQVVVITLYSLDILCLEGEK